MNGKIAAVLVVLSIGFVAPPHGPAQEPDTILESYTLGHGGHGRASAVLSDESLGGGTASTHIVFTSAGTGSHLLLRVRRHVGRGEITFALLVFRVEIRAHNADGELVYSRDLPGFTFGDSTAGRWLERVNDLPAHIAHVTITFVGNYE